MVDSNYPSKIPRLLGISLATLGVVFGDIGTSPLYAMRVCFYGRYGMEPTSANIFGILSLIVWALLVVISIKYIVFILRANNCGEGGILALSALISQIRPSRYLTLLGVFGAALLYSDGMITPAITVLGALEGLELATPVFRPFVVPLAVLILIGLFLVQNRGTATIGTFFGPLTLLWFLVIAVLGLQQIIRTPEILWALSPHHSIQFFMNNGWHGIWVVGAVFLVVTGGEALYADMGHFGIKPIRLTWFSLVLPALLLNYFGQGALLLQNPAAAENPFFALAQEWALYPLVGLSSIAAVIASQAVISGTFSLTMQAVQLGYSPRLEIRHTSDSVKGQVYIPLVNWALMLSCIALVLSFKSSSNLAAAYGLSIASTMTITTVLFYVVARFKWRWNPWITGIFIGFFLAIDIAFLITNLTKILHGGWFPLIVAAVILALMLAWRRGRAVLAEKTAKGTLPLRTLINDLHANPPVRVSGTAFFMSSNPRGTPLALLHNLKHNKILHECVVILNIGIVDVPHVAPENRFSVERFEFGFWRMSLRFGFMDEPDVPAALESFSETQPAFAPQLATFFLGRETIRSMRHSGHRGWQNALFSWMSQNARDATSFFRLPPGRVVELGAQVEI